MHSGKLQARQREHQDKEEPPCCAGRGDVRAAVRGGAGSVRVGSAVVFDQGTRDSLHVAGEEDARPFSAVLAHVEAFALHELAEGAAREERNRETIPLCAIKKKRKERMN